METLRSIKGTGSPVFRLGLQGPSGSGKTTSALTFPNPILLNFDNNIEAFTHLDIPEVPFHDEKFVCDYGFKPTRPGAFPNRRDALTKWLREEGLKLGPERSVIFDSWTTIQSSFDAQQSLEPKITKEGGEDAFHFWGKKIDYSEGLMQFICSMKCNVCVCFHELQTRDAKTGQLLTKIEPLMQGKFVAQIKVFFPNFFRMIDKEDKDDKGNEKGCKYFWQVKSSADFSAKTSLDVPDGTQFIEPNYSSFLKYKRKA